MWRNLLFLAGGVPMVVLLAALVIDRWKRKRSGDRPPQQEKLLRPPGHSLSLRLADLGDNMSGWMMGAFLASLTAVGVLSVAQSTDTFAQLGIVLLFGCGSAGCTVMAWKTAREIRQYRLGLMGEQSVAEQMQKLVARGFQIYHDVPGEGKWNIDHVAVGPTGVFAIETKCRTKRRRKDGECDHEAIYDGKIIHFPNYADLETPTQAARNASWLAKMLARATGERVDVQPIVALPGWWVTLKAKSDLKVLSGKQLSGFIAKEPAVLSAKAIEQISYQLDQRCRDVEF